MDPLDRAETSSICCRSQNASIGNRTTRFADRRHSMVNARNKVPEHQRFYQNAYANHQRLWRIVCGIPLEVRIWDFETMH